VEDTLEDWFRREILPYEAPLMRYLSRKRAIPLDPADLRNDIYIRVLESAEKERPNSPKAFLFATARHLLIDHARRNRVVAIDLLEDLDVLNVLIDTLTPERQTSGRQQLTHLSAIFDRMPPRQREVLWLRRIEGLSQKDAAKRLGLTEGAIEKHVHRGMRFLAEALYGASDARGDHELQDDSHHIEPRHGK
jgi:RNA polymerase sigma factor (sigma-70 family)